MCDIDSLQNKVYEYENDVELCAELSEEQCQILAELQTIYNTLNGQTTSKASSMFSTTCYGIRNAMENLTRKYADIEPAKLCEIYKETYKKAKEEFDLKKL